jgi:peptidylprolyl isomerase
MTGAVAGVVEVPRFPGEPVNGDWIETDSGLMYYDIVVGEGAEASDDGVMISIHYTGYLIDGTQFDSSYDRGQPAQLPRNGFLVGWDEGIKTMRAGGRRKLILPHELAFGESGRPPIIPPKAMLVFDIELLEVLNYSRVPEELPGEPLPEGAELITTESGLSYYELAVGDGEMPAGPETKVKVHYTGYLNDGSKFDSSVDRGQPATFALNAVIPGWTEGVGSMNVGGKRKIIIPFELGYGEQGSRSIPPRALLIFDVELIEIVEDAPPAAPPAEGGDG